MRIAPGIAVCAGQELTLAIRSRATQIFACVFGGLALAVSASGYILSGGTGVQDFARTATSLVDLVLFVVPLMSLVLGTTALSPERGAAELLFSQPVERRHLLWGRMLGLFAALTAAEALGFGASGLVIFSQSGPEGLPAFLWVIGGAVGLTMVFLCVAALIAVVGDGRRRSRALATALLVWFALAIAYDVAALGLASLLHSRAASRLLMVAALANPIDGVRTGLLLAVQGSTAFGAASLALLRFTGGPIRAGMLIAFGVALWCAVPGIIASRRLERADI